MMLLCHPPAWSTEQANLHSKAHHLKILSFAMQPEGREWLTVCQAFRRQLSIDMSCHRVTQPEDANPNHGITVLVTGVSGYIGAHVAKHSVEAGYTVKGTVRNHKYDATLKAVLPDVTLVELDLHGTVEEFASIFKGSQFVCHVASPFPGGQVALCFAAG